jgi:hypothetical protein
LSSLGTWSVDRCRDRGGSGDEDVVHVFVGPHAEADVEVGDRVVTADGDEVYVLGTARAGKHDFLRGLGLDEPIDYTTTDLGGLRDIDVVLDTVGYGPRALRGSSPVVTLSAPRGPRWGSGVGR